MESVWRPAMWVLASMLLAGCTDEVMDAGYPATSDAVASGAVRRGWVPAWVPASARNLQEVHDVDTNQSALSFTLERSGWRPPAPCRPAEGGEFSEPAFDRSWIPSGQDLTAAYDLYGCPSGHDEPMLEAVAVQREGTHVLHWRVFSR